MFGCFAKFFLVVFNNGQAVEYTGFVSRVNGEGFFVAELGFCEFALLVFDICPFELGVNESRICFEYFFEVGRCGFQLTIE